MGPSQMLLVVLANNFNMFWSLFPASAYHKHPGITPWILLIDARADNWRNIFFKKTQIKPGFEYFAFVLLGWVKNAQSCPSLCECCSVY